jgi:hypothetical protein
LTIAFFLTQSAPAMSRQRLKRLDSFEAVLEALGGSKQVGELLDQKANAASTWKTARGVFPPKYYFSMKGALRDRGYWAPIQLWAFHSKAAKFRGPKRRKAKAAKQTAKQCAA